uniref:Uncharacterized protein n=1 Tax=Panagrolaimus sp. ES5 TaxID=591445 RepID=A0AC34FM35_9BILA
MQIPASKCDLIVQKIYDLERIFNVKICFNIDEKSNNLTITGAPNKVEAVYQRINHLADLNGSHPGFNGMSSSSSHEQPTFSCNSFSCNENVEPPPESPKIPDISNFSRYGPQQLSPIPLPPPPPPSQPKFQFRPPFIDFVPRQTTSFKPSRPIQQQQQQQRPQMHFQNYNPMFRYPPPLTQQNSFMTPPNYFFHNTFINLQFFSKEVDQKDLFCYFQSSEDSMPGNLELIAINASTKQIFPEYCSRIPPKNVLQYFQEPSDFLKKRVKVAIFQTYDFKNPSFLSNSDFRRLILQQFKKHQINVRFIDKLNFNLTMLFGAAMIDFKRDNSIMVIFVDNKKIFIEELNRTFEGYTFSPMKPTKIIECQNGYAPIEIKEKIFRNGNPKKIIVTTASTPYSKQLWLNILWILQDKNYIAVENTYSVFQNAAIVEIGTHVINEKFNRYYITPKFSFLLKNDLQEYASLIECDFKEERLPFIATVVQPRNHGKYYIEKYYQDQKESEIVKMCSPLTGQYHAIEFRLTVGSKLKPSLTQKKLCYPKIQSLPSSLNGILKKSKVDSKIPVIVFYDNLSVICIWDELRKCYKFAQNWNGLYGKDLYIAFDKEKPTFFDEAIKVLDEKPYCVVYDLAEILGSKDSCINLGWKFVITKDDENPVLIEFENSEGGRNAATPQLLMALFLKEHLKAIKNEIGKKPKEVGFIFCFTYHKFHQKDYSLLLERMKKACDLLENRCKIFIVADGQNIF